VELLDVVVHLLSRRGAAGRSSSPLTVMSESSDEECSAATEESKLLMTERVK
jgi:hypothetical protein